MTDLNDMQNMDIDALLSLVEETSSNYYDTMIEAVKRSDEFTDEQNKRISEIMLNQTSRAYDILGITERQANIVNKKINEYIFDPMR